MIKVESTSSPKASLLRDASSRVRRSGSLLSTLERSASGSFSAGRAMARVPSGSGSPMLGRASATRPSKPQLPTIQYEPGAIRLAEFENQPPCRIHPNMEIVNLRLKEWTIDMLEPLELGVEAYIDEYNTMASYVFADCSDERLEIIGKLSNLQYVHDDLIDGRRVASSGPYSQALRTILKEPKILLLGCRDIMKTLATAMRPTNFPFGDEIERLFLFDYYLEAAEGFVRLSNPEWMGRFSKNLKTFYESQVNSSTKPKSFTSCSEFVEYRAANSGMMHSVDEIEFAQENWMPTGVLEHKAILEMQQNVILVGSLSNDIFSFEKETIRDGMHHANLVHVAMTTEDLSIEKAVRKTADIVRDNMDTFYRLKTEVDSWNRPDVSRYVVGLENFLLGCWPWQLSTDRYRSHTSPFAELLLPTHLVADSVAEARRLVRSDSAPSLPKIAWSSPAINRRPMRPSASFVVASAANRAL